MDPKQRLVRLVGDEQAAHRIATGAPDGFEVVAYVDCGLTAEHGTRGGPTIRLLRGQPHTWRGAEAHGPVGSVAFDTQEVIYELAGLKPDGEYVLGFTWWDFDRRGRRQSVRFGGLGHRVEWLAVLPATAVESYYQDKPTFSQVHLPLAKPMIRSGRLSVSFLNEGPANAVVSEIWLLEKAASARPAAGSVRGRVLIVTGDDYPGHLWRLTAPELAAILRADPRLEVTITESPAVLASPLLGGHYDAVLMHYKNWERPDAGPEALKVLRRFIESGKGFMLVHFACGAFHGSSDYAGLAGRVWDPKLPPHDPYGPFSVRITDHQHPITAHMSAFKTTDELYTCLAGDTPIRLLAEAVSVVDHKPYPMAFVHEVGKGRVFFSPLGHDVNSMKSPGTRELFRRGAAWAAGLPQMD